MRKSFPPSPSRLTEIGGLGYPLLFHWLALLMTSGLLLLAAVNRIVPLLLLTVFVLLLAAISWYWSRRALDGLSVRVCLKESRAFPGETVELDIRIGNAKWLPLTWSEMEIEVPYRLVHGRSASSPHARERPRWTTSLLGGQEIGWRHAVSCRARGEYEIGPVRLRTGDIFGLFPREMLVPSFASLLVYPRVLPVDKLAMPMRELTGERGLPRSIYEDASRLMGARDYQPEDPLKGIHWKASARQNRLETKLYESSTSQSCLFMLDVHAFLSRSEADFELAVTTVASLSHQADQEGCSTGLVTNSIPEVRIPVASGHRQFLAILEALARVEIKSETPLYQMVEKGGIKLLMGAMPVVVTPVTPSLVSLLRKLEQGGHSPVVVSIGTGLSRLPPGVTVIQVRSAGDLSRRYSEAK